MKNISVNDFCDQHHACKEGREWGNRFPSMSDAYNAFMNDEGDIDHMIWTYVRAADHKDVIRFACFCARQNWNLLTDERSKKAVEITEMYIEGKATLEEVKVAVCAANAASRAANAVDAADYAAYAANAVDYAARAAVAANAAAANAVYAANAVDYAAQRDYLIQKGNPFEK